MRIANPVENYRVYIFQYDMFLYQNIYSNFLRAKLVKKSD